MNERGGTPLDEALRESPGHGGTNLVTVLSLGVFVTAIALPESWRGWPYAPFPLLHASLALAIPLLYRKGPMGRPWSETGRHLRRQGLPILVAIGFIGSFVVVYGALLRTFGKTDDPGWNIVVTYHDFGQMYIARYGKPVVVVVAYLLLGIWPMFGEELFYRGFLLHGLTEHFSEPRAALVTSVLFGLRHAAQLSYLLPYYPVPAGLAYCVWAFGLSLIWCWVYLRTRSLWLCIASHGVNVILAAIVIVFLVR